MDYKVKQKESFPKSYHELNLLMLWFYKCIVALKVCKRF